MKYKNINGLLIPSKTQKQKQTQIQKQKEISSTKWNCPHCGFFYDKGSQEETEEAMIGYLGNCNITHITCPQCKKCMGCEE